MDKSFTATVTLTYSELWELQKALARSLVVLLQRGESPNEIHLHLSSMIGTLTKEGLAVLDPDGVDSEWD